MSQQLLPSRDEIIAAAKSGPELLASAQAFDPALAQRLQGEALGESKTLAGSAIAMGLSWLTTKYGLGWDPSFCALLAGGLTLAVHALVHWVQNRPLIRGPAAPPEAPLVGRSPQ